MNLLQVLRRNKSESETQKLKSGEDEAGQGSR